MGDGDSRGISSVISVILLVAVTVVLAATMTVFVFDIGSGVQSPAPVTELSHDLVADGGEQTIAITLVAGDAVRTERLYVTATPNVDIGGAPDSATPANDAYASRAEKFTESSGDNPPQVGIGPTWDAGETVYIDPVGDPDEVRITVYWSSRSVVGVNPGDPSGEHTYRLREFTVTSS